MSTNIRQEIHNIVIPKELHERSILGIQQAKKELPKKRKWAILVVFTAGLMILFFSFNSIRVYMERPSPNDDSLIVLKDGGLQIPSLQLPENTANESADMIGLIVYNGKIYTQAATEIDSEDAKNLVGIKLGTTKGNIDEWSKQDAYAVEFASTIGEADVYTVKGYDKNFRIMTYNEHDGMISTGFYECLNGIAIYDGGDVFGHLNMIGNVVSAQYQVYSDWYNSTDRFYSIENVDLLNRFVEELNDAVPYSRQAVEKELGNFRNDDEYRKITIRLSDGSNVGLAVIKEGYVFYGVSSVYFKMDRQVFLEFWELLGANKG